MYQTIIKYINTLNEKDLKYLYERYLDMAFTFHIDCEEAKYNRALKIINLIDETLREKGYWKK